MSTRLTANIRKNQKERRGSAIIAKDLGIGLVTAPYATNRLTNGPLIRLMSKKPQRNGEIRKKS